MRRRVLNSLILLGVLVGFGYNTYTDRQTVEHYCSVSHAYNVADYNACKKLSQSDLIKTLTKDASKGIEIVDLEPLK